MKFFCQAAALTYFFVGFSFLLKAQSVAEVTASATIVSPVTLEKIADMSVSNLYVKNTTGGTVVFSPSGVRLNMGGISLPVISENVTLATFTFTSSKIYSIDISLPLIIRLNRTNGSETMTASAFTPMPSLTTSSEFSIQKLSIGATLTFAASQASGTYTSSEFNVTANYN